MTARDRETGKIMDRFLEELGEPLPSTVRIRRASQRVLENLSSFGTVVGDAEAAALPGPEKKRDWTPVAAVAAALVAAVVLVGTLSLPGSAQPIARRLNGNFNSAGDSNSISEGKLIQTGSSGGEVLALRDGSRVEMSDSVKLSINRAADGIQVDLKEGNIIVTAAKQHNGHLYVKTRDCVVSVVGTVFSVKAEAAGSRVAVIEGEVHVQHGDVLQTLLPGQQVATSTEMKAVPIQSEIGWSQDAAAHVAMLEQAVPAASPAQTPAAGGTTPANPELSLGQGDAVGPNEKKKTFFYSLWEQNTHDLKVESRPGVWSSIQNQAAPPNSFNISITGIQGRTISFSNSKNETFSYGCADCSFVVTENGISKTVSDTEPGMEFRLGPDGTTLTATCHAATCSMGRWFKSVSWAATRGASNEWSYGVTYSRKQANRESQQVFTIPTSLLMQQQGGSVLFVVTKPAGQ